ncbi:lymphocyte function-associated antigen 3 [Pimephales promelas]|uniref:lymphocyte function-associated antigen 3 n=1 Tax=Pimephales promelas TaxID=90988 RepID=UPI001955B7A5|nr:lymphocyte function-associated antigen 3 [Pimephales promelas]
MAATSLVFITCLCLARDFVFCDEYKEIGKDITLTPSIRGKPTDIQWTHNEDKVLVYDGREVVEYASFKHRVVVDFETGQLTIKKLTSQDSGQYQSQIMINGKVQTSSHTVTVLDVLPEPQVTCEPGETSDVKKLFCSVESRTQPSYEWSGLNMKLHSGPELLVEEQEENRDSVYTCTVKNQANSRSTNFTLTDCHTGRAGTAVLVPVIIIPLLILLILLGVFLYRRKEKSRQSGLKKIDPENGEGHSLMRNYQKDVMPGSSSSEATLPSHARLPPQNKSIIDQKWDQANEEEGSGGTNEGHKPLKETLKQSPQSAVSDTNQQDTESGSKGELDKNVKNSEHAVEAEENTDETEKERDKQRLEEEKENRQTQEEFPEQQNERKTEDNRENNQTPGEKEETKDRGHTDSPANPEMNSSDSSSNQTDRDQEQEDVL